MFQIRSTLKMLCMYMFSNLDDVVSSLVGPCAFELQAWSMFSCFIALYCYWLACKQSFSLNDKIQQVAVIRRQWKSKRQYPWVIKSDPVFHSVSKSFKTKTGKVIKVVHHADVLPTSKFLLQNLLKPKNRNSCWQFCFAYIWLSQRYMWIWYFFYCECTPVEGPSDTGSQ